MNAAGKRTRDKILSAAFRLFSEKGFANVSMSDFCEACGLSRGGLYRHFQSTGEIFEAMLESDKNSWSENMHQAFSQGVPAAQMLRFYLDTMREGMLRGDGRLSLAAYEYVRMDDSRRAFANMRYRIAADMFAKLLEYGIGRGEFRPCSVRTLASHCVIFIDGLRIASAMGPVDQETVTGQLDSLYDFITTGKEQ